MRKASSSGRVPRVSRRRRRFPGIWLREGGGREEARLVLPRASFDVRESLEFVFDNRRYLLTPIELEEISGNFEIGRYREQIVE